MRRNRRVERSSGRPNVPITRAKLTLVTARRCVVAGALIGLALQPALGIGAPASNALTLPSLPKLHVQPPRIKVPTITAPALRSPQAPVSVPPTSNSTSPGSGAPSSTGSGLSTAGSAIARTVGALSFVRSGGPTASAPATAGAAPSGGEAAAAARASETSAAASWTRYLRSVVFRLDGCLSGLPTRWRSVLMLRAGIGTRGYSQRSVAKMLRLSLVKERGIEREAVASLQGEAADRGCGSTQFSLTAVFLGAVNGGLGLLGPFEAISGLGTGAQSFGHLQAALNAHRRRAPSLPAAVSQVVQGAGIPPVPGPGSGSSSWLLEAIAALGLLGAGVLGTELVHRIRSRHSSDVPTPVMLQRRGESAAAAAVLEPPVASPASGERDVRPERHGGAGLIHAELDVRDDIDPVAASNLGVLLEHRGDVAGAAAAYSRADARGDAAGAFNLGGLLAQRGDYAGAIAAYRRADERGAAGAAFRLGVLLKEHGDLSGASTPGASSDQPF